MYSAGGEPQNLFVALVSRLWNVRRGPLSLCLSLLLSASVFAPAAEPPRASAEALPGLLYTNSRIASVPWSIHVVRLERADPRYQIQSLHARGQAVGMDTLSGQLGLVNPARGCAVTAINGDFYQRDKTYEGAPRGLQIVGGELLSAPSGGASFWIDALGQLHAGQVESQFQITWPNGSATAFGLNAERAAAGVELFTPAIGPSTRTQGGRELILTRVEDGPWLPLRIGRAYKARVREIRETGNTALAPDIMVLSLGPKSSPFKVAQLQAGALLEISTGSLPALHGVKTAISGGPLLLRNGKRERLNVPDSQSYQVSSMLERHPRAAVGWNETYFFLVEVDGRQRDLSVGMTLDEFAKFLDKLGCREAMNFDGGGSATLWYNGQVRNSPCDQEEREIANCLVIVKNKK